MSRTEVIPQLANCARTLKYTAKFMDPKFQKVYTTAIFKGKLLFAAEAWGGASKSLLSKVQAIQDRVSKATLGPKSARLSATRERPS